MKLSVVHRTRYEYAAPVRSNSNEARLQPISQVGQICHKFDLNILPSAPYRVFYDFYSNIVHYFELSDPHEFLEIVSSSIVETVDRFLDEQTRVMPLDQLHGLIQVERCFDFLQSSTLIPQDPEVWKLALDATADCSDLWDGAL